jgi:hypothetical protein
MQVITVGQAKEWIPELVRRAQDLRVGSGFDKSTDVYAMLQKPWGSC